MLADKSNSFARKTLLGLCAVACLGVSFASRAAAEPVPFLVPTRTVYPGQDIAKGRLEIRHFRASYGASLDAVKFHRQVKGKVATKTLVPMRPILLKYMRDPHMVRTGARSKLIFSKGNLTITATVTALQSGSVGDVIRVRNIDSGKFIMARVRPDGALEVERP
ncbi:MAG: flagellar basal body P-ring formation protein FlgA [Rhodobacteraceae bacterium]|nr:flagellar basal body P-ring formation protein FlgA [Paracoccaceae bacterium]